MASRDLPIIDIAPFRSGGAAAVAVVADIARACRDIGFFIVTGHGVSDVTTTNLYYSAREFFDSPAKADRVGGPQIMGGIGFAPIGQEALAATKGVQTPGDIKESLNFGPRLAGSSWPTQPAGLHAAFADYFAEMERLAHCLRGIFCAAMGLPEDHFEADFIEDLSALRVINYPAQTEAPSPGQLRAGAHTDYGFMTILRSEATPGGLQVQRRDGVWIDMPAAAGGFVINIADALMRWTNDVFVSTPHRVANPPQTARGTARRQSIAFFVNPSADTCIECLAPFCAPGQPVKYPPIRYRDYIALKTSQAFSS